MSCCPRSWTIEDRRLEEAPQKNTGRSASGMHRSEKLLPTVAWPDLRARTRTHSANAAPSFRATGEPRWILESRDGDDLECLRHRREHVQQVNEIVNLGPEFHGHRCLVYQLACVVTDYRHAQHFVCVDVDRHLDDSARVADCARAGHVRHRERVAPAPMTGGD